MASRSCPTCGATRPQSRAAPCPVCGAGGASQPRAYRGLAAYRTMRAHVIERDDGICGICGGPGADCLGHVRAYSTLDPATRDDPSTWNADDFRATHADCERRNGTRPLEAPL
jgi:hypothetical protein